MHGSTLHHICTTVNYLKYYILLISQLHTLESTEDTDVLYVECDKANVLIICHLVKERDIKNYFLTKTLNFF